MDSYLDKIQKKIDDITQNIINKEYQIINLCGPSGTGKSYIVESVAAKLKDKANKIAVIQLFGDMGKKSIPYFPFNQYLEYNSNWKKGLGPFIEGIPYLGVGIRHILDTTDCRPIIGNKRDIKDNATFSRNLSFSKELFLLFKRFSHIAIICDDVHNFDQDSIDYLRGIITEFNVKGERISVLASYNITEQNNPYTFSRHSCLCINLHYPSKIETVHILHQWGLDATNNIDDVDAIYAATGGHLVLLNQVCRFYSQNNNEFKINTDNDELFYGDLIDKRIRKTPSGNLIINLLETLAAIGRSATINELKCALNNIESIHQTIIDAISLNLLSKDLTTVSFINDSLRRITLKRSHLNNSEFFMQYSRCLKTLMPSDYERRALAEELAGNHLQSQVLSGLHIIEQIREGFTPNLITIDDAQVLNCIQILTKAYRLSFNGENDVALNYLINESKGFTESLLYLEIKYAIYTFRFKSNQINSRETALFSLIGDLDNCDQEEIEIWSRLMRIRMVLESALSKLEEARSTYRDHQNRLRSRERYDNRLAKAYYECQLLSDSLYEPDVVHSLLLDLYHKMKKRVSYGDVRSISLYYKVLINLSGNSIMVGLYEEACQYAEEAIQLVEKCDFMQFPNADVAINNYLLSSYYLKSISSSELVEKFQNVVKSHQYDEDEILIKLNYAGFLLLTKRFSEALLIMDEIAEKKEESLDAYYEYYFLFDRSLALYLMGEVKMSKRLMYSLEKIITSAFPIRTQYYQKHYSIVSQLLQDGTSYESLQALQKAFTNRQESFLSSDWEYFKTVYLFSDLQIWTQF